MPIITTNEHLKGFLQEKKRKRKHSEKGLVVVKQHGSEAAIINCHKKATITIKKPYWNFTSQGIVIDLKSARCRCCAISALAF